ncbi:PRD domain-containing protein [Streptomyces sp. NBC_00481]|uniref:PRD domain-containing protein n=1 Tax=unclassified Streptomyces TaxID=2593676 RepID=UPI002DDA79FA|nr:MULTISPECIES: PRD domain-containing protein [unclassified Streptomyces]WRY98363.1 PRD domain-containing protein [Streptomyces sp. NBC_00481]
MRVVKIFNNNVVLAATDNGDDVVVLMGRGLGFGVRAGQDIDAGRAERTFMPTAGQPPERIARFLEEIPAEHLGVAEDIVRHGRTELGDHIGDHVVIPLADHLSFALRRAQDGLEIAYPLRGEVLHFYPREVAVGRRAVELVADRIGIRLPDIEAIPLALHFVNAQFEAPDLDKVMKLTETFTVVLAETSAFLDTPVDGDSLEASRFITHLRYLANRQESGTTAADTFGSLHDSLRASHAREVACAEHIGRILEERLGWILGRDEVLYLALHISRLTARSRAT